MRVVVPALLAGCVLAAPTVASADDTCAPARVMVVLDKSSSMVTGSIGTSTKWDIAVGGLGQVLGAYDLKAEFGLMTFPKPNQCGPGAVEVAPAMANRTAILDALGTPPPNAGNWTPMAQTLEVAAQDPSLVAAPGARHVIVVTDGWQWCSPYDPETRYDGVAAVGKLYNAGVTTWVVGFGAEVDASALNQMAVMANTERPNCDVNSADPAAANNCYFQVDNATELVNALTAITNTIVATELCDGIDNDCDGEVDEDLTRDCSTDCGAGVETCNAGAWSGCTAPAPTTCAGDDDSGTDPQNPETGGMQAGCACDTSGGPGAGSLAMFLALGAFVIRRRR